MNNVNDALFQPHDLGTVTLPNRVLMSPLTRSRSSQPGDVPNDMNAQYYQQRAGAGLIISEATQVSPQGKGYAFTPGIHSEEQIEGWRKVTSAVHMAGGRIHMQLWHVGRISHTALQPDGNKPVAPSAIKPEGAKTFISADSGMVDVPEPVLADRLRARWSHYDLTEDQIRQKLEGNDLPNGRTVRTRSRPADLVLTQ